MKDGNNSAHSSRPQLQALVDERSLLNDPSKSSTASEAAEWYTRLEGNLMTKLQWASRELEATSSVEDSTHLCLLIKACAEALKSVRDLDSKPYNYKQQT